MLSKNDLINGEVNATDDMEGVNTLIKHLHNTIMKKHMKVYDLFEERKSDEAIELRETIRELSTEVDAMMKRQMTYQKFLTMTGEKGGKNEGGVSKELKKQKSSNGDIVATIPKT